MIGGVNLQSLTLDASNRKKNAAILAAGYSVGKRRFEIAIMAIFVSLECIVGYTAIVNTTRLDAWLIVCTISHRCMYLRRLRRSNN